MSDNNISMQCPHCGKTVKLTRDNSGRWIATSVGLTIGGSIGAIIGAGIGIATGGTAMAATIPAGIALGTILGGGGYIIGDKLLDTFKCPACKGQIDL